MKANSRRFKIDAWALIFSLIVSTLLVIGTYIVDRVFAGTPVLTGRKSLPILLFCIILLTAFFYLIAILIFSKLDQVSLNTDMCVTSTRDQKSEEFDNQANAPVPTSSRHVDIISAQASSYKTTFLKLLGLFLACWIPYFFIRFPGNLDSDTLWQLLQTNGLAVASDHHPWFDTLIFSAFWTIGNVINNHSASVLLYAILQMLITAAAFSNACCYMKSIGVHKALRTMSVIFFCLYPAVPLFAQSMMKDSLFAWLWVLLLLCFAEILRSKGECVTSSRFLVIFFIVLLLSLLTKKTALYIVLLFSPFVIIYCINNRLKLLSIITATICVYSIAWQSIILPALGIEKGSSREMLSLPASQTANYIKLYGNELTDEDWSILSGVYTDPKTMGDSYIPARADSSKERWTGGSSKGAQLAYARWFIGALVKHPDAFLLAAGSLTLPLYYPDTFSEGDESLIFYRDNIASRENRDPFLEQALTYYSGGTATPEQLDSFLSGMYRNPFISQISRIFNSIYLRLMSIFPILFSKVLYVFWLPFLLACWSIRTKRYGGLCFLVAYGVMLLSMVFGPIALPRYFAPIVYAAPLIVLVPYLDTTVRGRHLP